MFRFTASDGVSIAREQWGQRKHGYACPTTRPFALESITAPILVIVGDQDPLAQRPEVLVDAIVSAELAIKISAITPGSLEIQRSSQLWWSSFAEARSPLQSG
jgi:pimeloyl-ACP methyl ester carboxylesterase